MTAPMDAKLCREAFEKWYYETTKPKAIGARDSHYEARLDAWQSAWQTRTPPAAPSPEVAEWVLRAVIDAVTDNDYADTYELATHIIKAMRPYLAPQGAVRVSEQIIARAINLAMQPTDGSHPGDLVKVVILSLKNQNPEVMFYED